MRQRPRVPAAAWVDPRRAPGEPTTQQQQQHQAPPPSAPPPPPPTKQQQALYEQTARHLLELNQRRAELQEQNAALLKEKHDLAARLQRAEAELARAAEQVAAATAAAAAAVAAAAAAAPPPAEAAPAPPSTAPPPAAFTIEYHSGWPRAFLHYRPSGGAWTAAPGVAMRRVGAAADDGGSGRHVFALEVGEAAAAFPADAHELEFALNDGAGDWDSAGGSNYRVAGRGAWRVRSGRAERVN
jgi:hypothetical protein